MTGRPLRAGWWTAAAVLPAWAWLAGCAAAPPRASVTFTDLGPRVAVLVDGELLTEYRREGALRPVLWPLFAPGGPAVTRAFPLAAIEGEPRDHAEQQSLWFGHGDVNGHDFWNGPARIVDQELTLDAQRGVLSGVSSWQHDGRELCRDFHSYTFGGGATWRTIDVDLTVVASNGELVFGDVRDGLFALRLRPELALRGAAATGAIADSEGRRDLEVWGKPARWVAYTGTVQGRVLTVAVLDHPQNHGHPTRWHARDYGLLAANPFALHDFTGSPPGQGALTVPAGGRLQCRYRVWLGTGKDRLPDVERSWQQFAAPR